MNKFFIILLTLFFLSGCKSAQDAFSLKKENNADEFLVKKKNPLVLPPSFDELPKPDNTQIQENEKNSFEVILKDSNSDIEISEDQESKSLEEFIIKKIKSNEDK